MRSASAGRTATLDWMGAPGPPEDCCFDDWVDSWVRKARKRGATVNGVTASLLRALEDAGIRDRSVLDLGCGIGDLAIEAVRHGAASARGFDLSPKAIGEARRLAADRGAADRTTFDVGDASKVDLPAADAVVLNRVFCCYPDVDGLLDRSLAAAGSVYAFTMPRSAGLIGAVEGFSLRLQNWWMRRRPKAYGGFQAFVHDVDAVDARVRAAGFRPIRREHRRLVWELAVYAR
jgi:magnesium-protoporphyrin O-methyltransferase